MAAVPALGNQAQVQLNQYLSEIPAQKASQLHCKALSLKTLAIITNVAIVAIVAAVLIVSLGLGAVSGTLPFVLVGLAISTPFLAMAGSKLWTMGDRYALQYKIEKGVADEHAKLIEELKTPEDLQQLFIQHNWRTDQLPMDALRLLNPTEPLRALLPLIARYKYCAKQGLNQMANEREIILRKYDDRQLRFDARNPAYDRYEGAAIPRIIEAAFLSHVIQNPRITKNLSHYVTIHNKGYFERRSDREFDQNDVYLTFNGENPPAPVTLAQLEQNFDPEVIRHLIPIQV